jgi:hypothetical protein
VPLAENRYQCSFKAAQNHMLSLATTLKSAADLFPEFKERFSDLKGEHRGVCLTEMFFVCAATAALEPTQILESGRARGQSTYVLAKCFPEARVISVELDTESPDAAFAINRLKVLPNVACLFGDSRSLLLQHLKKESPVLIDGPKDFRAIKLALNLLRTGLPCAVFIHDLSDGKAARRFLERNIPDAFFSDHPDFVSRYATLDEHSNAPGFSWACFACIPGGVRRRYRLLLAKRALARAIAVVSEKISKALAQN